MFERHENEGSLRPSWNVGRATYAAEEWARTAAITFLAMQQGPDTVPNGLSHTLAAFDPRPCADLKAEEGKLEIEIASWIYELRHEADRLRIRLPQKEEEIEAVFENSAGYLSELSRGLSTLEDQLLEYIAIGQKEGVIKTEIDYIRGKMDAIRKYMKRNTDRDPFKDIKSGG